MVLVRGIATATMVLALWGLTPSVWAADDATSSVEDILEVLADRGLIDGDTQARILAKHESQQRQSPKGALSALLGDWDWSGDLRLRQETFRYRHDAAGQTASNRYRLRYRIRLAARKQIFDWLRIGFRAVSGSSDARSTNQSFGSGVDFDTDPFSLDQVWVSLSLPTRRIGLEGLEAELQAGKVPNPFLWKHGKDFLLWDHDITLEGATLRLVARPAEAVRLFGTFGYYVPEERASGADPTLYAGQLGGEVELTEALRAGVRVSGYEWRPLRSRAAPGDPAEFIDRALAQGNLFGAFDSRARIGEISGFVRLAAMPRWPVLLHGTFARNLLADRTLPPAFAGLFIPDEDNAWMAGIEVGDKKQMARFGFLYARVEANALVAQFSDSDLFDGKTNRRGFEVYGRREVAPNVDVNLELFQSREIESDSLSGLAPFASSVSKARRTRFRADLIVKFD